MREDPIGLAGGVNLYGFAAGDPVNLSDAYGLSPGGPTLPMPWPVVIGGAAAVGPLGLIGLAVAAVFTADQVFGSSGGSIVSGTAVRADATAFNRRAGRMLKKEWEGIHGVPWPQGCVAHHICPLGDGGVDAGSNIEPLAPGEHTEHRKNNGDFKRWGERGKKPKEEKKPDAPEPKP